MGLMHPCVPMAFSGLATGKSRPVGQLAHVVTRLPTDPVGSFYLTLTNLVVGSALQIEAQNGTPLHNRTAVGTSETIQLSAYGSGSPLNDLRIKVRKGSASPFYQPYETLATAFKGAQTIFVSQTPDE